MGTTGPTKQTVEYRQKLIDGLERVGGQLVVGENENRLDRDVLLQTFDIRLSPASFSSFLRLAEQDGIITRTVDGKRTKAIYLVHGARADVNYVPRTTPVKKAKRKYTKRQHGVKLDRPPRTSRVLPVPALGSTVSVFFASIGEDGQISLGLRGETGSWSVEIRGFTKAES